MPIDVVQWRAHLVRVTAFLANAQPPDAEEWWNRVVKNEPEVRARKPNTSVIEQSGAYVAAGLPSSGAKLILHRDGRRVEWRLGIATPDFSDPLPDTVGDLASASAAITEIAKAWNQEAGQVALRRLAFGAVCQLAQPSLEASQVALSTMLPTVQIGQAGATDIAFQINRFRPSTIVPGLRLNRLAKWSTMAGQVLQQVGLSIPEAVGTQFFVQLELDSNTDGNRKEPLPSGQFNQLLDELTAHALRIASDGDAQ